MSKWILVLALIAPTAVLGRQEPRPPGTETRAWLELQRSGNAALGAPRPMSGEVADKVYERYLRSFGHPIPDTFNRERFVSEGSSN